MQSSKTFSVFSATSSGHSPDVSKHDCTFTPQNIEAKSSLGQSVSNPISFLRRKVWLVIERCVDCMRSLRAAAWAVRRTNPRGIRASMAFPTVFRLRLANHLDSLPRWQAQALLSLQPMPLRRVHLIPAPYPCRSHQTAFAPFQMDS